VVLLDFPTGIARRDGGCGGAHGGSLCFSEALAWVGRGQEEVGDGLSGERRFGVWVGVSESLCFGDLEAVSRWSRRARPLDSEEGTSRRREGSRRGLWPFLAPLQDAQREVNLDRWHRSCLAQPPAKGSQASGLNAMGCSIFGVVWGWVCSSGFRPFPRSDETG
jgi:hypothetical protein